MMGRVSSAGCVSAMGGGVPREVEVARSVSSHAGSRSTFPSVIDGTRESGVRLLTPPHLHTIVWRRGTPRGACRTPA